MKKWREFLYSTDQNWIEGEFQSSLFNYKFYQCQHVNKQFVTKATGKNQRDEFFIFFSNSKMRTTSSV
jgi:hypothetical protein